MYIFLLSRSLQDAYFVYISMYLMVGIAIGAFVFTNLIVAVVVANLELSMREIRIQKQAEDNPLEFNVRTRTQYKLIIP